MIDKRVRIDTIRKLPILGVCGWSGSGKTTLIEAVLPRLIERNLKVAVVKHDVHAIDVDRPGKDSDRFFQAGGDVFLQGNEELSRLHRDPAADIVTQLIDLARKYDLILVEGHKQSPLPKVWLLQEGESSLPAKITDIRLVLGRGPGRFGEFLSFLTEWLAAQWLLTPVFGCVYVAEKGEQEHRAAKHQTATAARQRLHQIKEQLRDITENIVIVGNSVLPAGFADCIHLVQPPGIAGPLAGILTAMRWHPLVSWLTIDEGNCNRDFCERTLAQRVPGVWVILPGDDNRALKTHPGYYDFRAAGLLENVAVNKDFRVKLASHPKSNTVHRAEFFKGF
jgi:molybdopterin-guanine dinucleotide biosynthesis protein B